MVTRAALLLLALFLIPCSSALGDESLDMSALIGLDPPNAFRLLGAPARVYPLRGSQESQDDVVFYYSQHVYLFWVQNRVWQVRTDARYGGSVFSLRIGDTRERVLAVMGSPLKELADSLLFHLEDRGYPVRVRFYFENGRLSDVYCFRGEL